MKLLVELGREILDLFVDDGALALGILAVAAASAATSLLGLPHLYVGGMLLAGVLLVFAESVWRAMRR
jgi:hypothetical protein